MLQIAAALREAINLGRLGPGDRLPSESELTQHFGVARMTVRQAIQELKTEGLVTSEHGRGVFVRAAPVVRRLASERFARQHRDRGKAAFLAEAEKAGYAPGVDSIRVHEEPAPADAAERLKIATGAPVIVRDRRYLANGEPVEIATSYIPVDVARGTAIVENDSGPGGIYARLEESGHPLDRFVEEVAARMPTPGGAASLAAPARRTGADGRCGPPMTPRVSPWRSATRLRPRTPTCWSTTSRPADGSRSQKHSPLLV